ncbi:universal stress protein [Halocalculus aciditolerans]|uniref:UspA domain-containing protein n=1 Tax=Halocalculus aciditolerans TaxID=1383812 RepID=A0A830FMH7_9EURY|nr:universal stress protein [Halocalculus aciditolerans]GGL61072.1 hypothetical protein GCM10009039_19030 [Halocalculus aciditolerans]
MYTVLVAIDDDRERALEQAEAIADLPGRDEVEAILFHNFEDNPEGASVNQVAAVRRAREKLEDAGVTVQLAEGSGESTESILDAADDHDVDAVCVAARKRTPAGKVLFGSVTQGVILSSSRPVIVCGEA